MTRAAWIRTSLAAALLAGGCATQPDPWDVAAVEALPSEGTAFEKALQMEYAALGRMEKEEGDWKDARLFLDRARAAAAGSGSEPEGLESRRLRSEHVGELTAARAGLMAIIGEGARAIAPEDTAKAQGMFECWMQEREENIVPEQLPDVAFCRDGYEAAMKAAREKLASGLIVLVPDSDGTVGAADVAPTAGGGAVALAGDGEAVRIGSGGPSTFVADKEVIDTVFGDALAARPIPPRRFVLNFHSGGTDLDDPSKALIPEIRADLEKRPAYEIEVVGHTDRAGGSGINARLAKKRAERVRDILVERGFDAGRIAVSSHGEANPVVPTADGVAEARNRRVEVSVR